jgi:hypothetical protein
MEATSRHPLSDLRKEITSKSPKSGNHGGPGCKSCDTISATILLWRVTSDVVSPPLAFCSFEKLSNNDRSLQALDNMRRSEQLNLQVNYSFFVRLDIMLGSLCRENPTPCGVVYI